MRGRSNEQPIRERTSTAMPTPVMPYEHLGEALATDYLYVRDQFSDDQWDLFRRTRQFVDEEVLPVISGYWERAELPGR